MDKKTKFTIAFLGVLAILTVIKDIITDQSGFLVSLKNSILDNMIYIMLVIGLIIFYFIAKKLDEKKFTHKDDVND